MSALAEVVVTRLGLQSPLGADPAEVLARLGRGEQALAPRPGLSALPDPRAAVVPGPDLRPLLKRRKDARLLARPAELALAAAAAALGGGVPDRHDLGLFLGVGREPPDQGESEPALAAAARDGALDEALLAGPGRDLYPPLLPLRTLPNMALAHISINLDIMGENGAWAGGPGAGWAALHSAWWALAEGRSARVLAGGADSLIDLGSARDRLRMGATDLPGEAAALLLLETPAAAEARGAKPICRLRLLSSADAQSVRERRAPALRAAMGDLGAAEGPMIVALAVAAREAGPLSGGEPGLPAVGLHLEPL